MMVYFIAIWYILWPLGTVCGYFVYFFQFWYVVPIKIWQPSLAAKKLLTYFTNQGLNSTNPLTRAKEFQREARHSIEKIDPIKIYFTIK
jgi:hypothetical protein